MNNRIKQIRKAKKMTQADFGKELNLSSNYIYMLEKADKPITDNLVYMICSKFDVNEEWLRSGIGEMFISHSTDVELAEISANLFKRDDLSDKEKDNLLKIINVAAEMTPEQINTMIHLAHKLSDMVKENELPD